MKRLIALLIAILAILFGGTRQAEVKEPATENLTPASRTESTLYAEMGAKTAPEAELYDGESAEKEKDKPVGELTPAEPDEPPVEETTPPPEIIISSFQVTTPDLDTEDPITESTPPPTTAEPPETTTTAPATEESPQTPAIVFCRAPPPFTKETHIAHTPPCLLRLEVEGMPKIPRS